MKVKVPIDIITCPQWRAVPPDGHIEVISKAKELVMHHTFGHVRQLGDPDVTTREEAMQYARDILRFHMEHNGWKDSGHNFLVCRAGYILQGRWFTVTAITQGKMVHSAHAGDNTGNTMVGIEFEHTGSEEMTAKQFESGARLMAWIAGQYQRTTIPVVRPHSFWSSTACPVNLAEDIPRMRARAKVILAEAAA